jgi:hypothetical protein
MAFTREKIISRGFGQAGAAIRLAWGRNGTPYSPLRRIRMLRLCESQITDDSDSGESRNARKAHPNFALIHRLNRPVSTNELGFGRSVRACDGLEGESERLLP